MLFGQIKENEEALQKKVDILESNINETLKNIQENGVNGASSGHRRNTGAFDDDEHRGKGSKYGFNFEYKLEVADKWSEQTTSSNNSSEFRGFKLKAERYLLSASKAGLSEGLNILLKYVENKDLEVDLKETNNNGDLIHQNIIDKVPNANEIDTILFNELMNLINK